MNLNHHNKGPVLLDTKAVSRRYDVPIDTLRYWLRHGCHGFPPPDLKGRPDRWFLATLLKWEKRKAG